MIKVISAGIQTSIQDLGRLGHRQHGVAQSGALDYVAMTQANYLLGNEAHEATIEIAIGAVELLAQTNSYITVVGNYTAITLTPRRGNIIPIRSGQVLKLENGDHLTIHAKGQFNRCYLALQGGIDVPSIMGSRSTDIAAGFGGLDGRCIQAHDTICSRPSNTSPLPQPSAATATNITASIINSRFAKPDQAGHTIRVIPGPEYPCLSVLSQQQLWQSDWQISTESNRMACRLMDSTQDNTAHLQTLKLADEQSSLSHGMPSHAVIPGTIQLPPQGMPIILLADCQTTGGYPRIGSVIEADLWRLAQMPISSLFRLVECDRPSAIKALQQQQQSLYRFKMACLQAKLT